MSTKTGKRAIVIGGSLGGLFAGAMLEKAGWEVAVYERSAHDLDSRGGGIVLQPEVVEVFRRAGVDTATMDLGVRSRHRTVFRRDGVAWHEEQTLTSGAAGAGDRLGHSVAIDAGVIVAGVPLGQTRSTNLMKLHRIGESLEWGGV